jgi:hypothetical protein
MLPARAQSSNTGRPGLFDEPLRAAAEDASEKGVELSLPYFRVSPELLESSAAYNRDLLRSAEAQRDSSAAFVRFYSDHLYTVRSQIEDARATLTDLQSQLTRARSMGGQPSSIAEMESSLKQMSSTLKQVTDSERYLESRLGSARLSMWKAEGDMRSARLGLFLAERAGPRFNSAVDFAAQHMDFVPVAQDTWTYFRDPTLFNFNTALISAAQYVGARTFWAELPINNFRDALREVELTANAVAHQREMESLAYGGVLSNFRITDGAKTFSNYGQLNGSFRYGESRDRLSIAGGWAAQYGDRADRFTAWSRYTFNQLSANSGQIFSGAGVVGRVRTEDHSLLYNEPLLKWLSPEPGNTTETTWRRESYHYSFNGSLVNESIRRATEVPVSPGLTSAITHEPPISVQPKPAEFELYNQDIVKRPPSVFLPPPSPPRPLPSALAEPLGLSLAAAAAGRGGIRMSVEVTEGDDLDFSALSGSATNVSGKEKSTQKPAAEAAGKPAPPAAPKKEK